MSNQNGDTTSTVDFKEYNKNNSEIQQLIASIKLELEKSGSLENPELANRLENLQKIVATIPEDNGNISSSVNKKVRAIRQVASTIGKQMQDAQEAEDLYRIVATQLQKVLQADRVIVYRFDQSDRGTVLMESLVAGWTPMLGEQVPALCFGVKKDIEYEKQQYLSLDDVKRVGLSPYQLQILDKYQVNASLALPVIFSGKVWGLVVAQQCEKT